MKTKEIKIEVPKGFEIDKENSTFEKIVFKESNSNPMLEVYKYHNITEEEFDKLYENLPNHVKAFQKECMIVSFYNKGWKPNWDNLNERKYYPWFYLGKGFSLNHSHCYLISCVSSCLVFRKEEDCEEAVEKFFEVYRESRNN